MAFSKSMSLFCLLAFCISQVFCQGAITVDYPAGGETFAIGDFVEVSFVYTEAGQYDFSIALIQDSINPGALSAQWNSESNRCLQGVMSDSGATPGRSDY